MRRLELHELENPDGVDLGVWTGAYSGAGESNTASATRSAVSGGDNNAAIAQYSAVSGGDSNTASGIGATVFGYCGVTVSNDNASNDMLCP